MSKRKQAPKDDRRRPGVEINLLAEHEESRILVRARRGCSLPFIGGLLTALAMLVALLIAH
jgi:hypothetical protein